MAKVSVRSGAHKTEIKGSLESQAFRKHFSELCIAISDPEWLASELLCSKIKKAFSLQML